MYKYEKAAVEKFGNNFIKNKQNELIFNCIKCNRPKLYVNTLNGLYHCFRCGYKGRLSSRASLADIRDKYNLDKLEIITNTKESKELNLIPFFSKALTEEQIKALEARGITESLIRYYHICGRQEDNRIQIPNFVKGCFTDVICAWEYDKSKIDKKTNPKYKNSEGTPKSKTLFNVYNIEQNPERIILCEGIFNAITAGKNAVASYGCELSNRQCELLIEKEPSTILIAYDSDEPGVKGSVKAIKKLIEYNYKGIIEYVLLPKGLDINDIGHNNFINYVSHNKVFIDKTSSIGVNLPQLLYDSRN